MKASSLMPGQPILKELCKQLKSLIPACNPSAKGGVRKLGRRNEGAPKVILFLHHTGIGRLDLPQQLVPGFGMTCWRRLCDWRAAGVREQG